MFIGRGKDHPLYNRVEKTCNTCGIAIYVIPARVKTQKFCSTKCYSELKKTRLVTKSTRELISKIHKSSGLKPPTMKGKSNPRWTGGMPKCSDCGDLLRDYNSKKCRSCHLKTYIGDKTPNWKGGITSKDKLQRRKFQQEMQKTIFERDDYTCQLCGVRGIDLQVDHIQSWAEYVELRFCIDNCRTLCASCHYKITFGKPMPPTIRAWGHNLYKGGIKP